MRYPHRCVIKAGKKALMLKYLPELWFNLSANVWSWQQGDILFANEMTTFLCKNLQTVKTENWHKSVVIIIIITTIRSQEAMNDDSYPSLCTDVPPPSEKNREKSLFSRFFSEGGGTSVHRLSYPTSRPQATPCGFQNLLHILSGNFISFGEEAGPLGLHRKSRPLLVRNDRRIGDGVLAAVRLGDWWSYRKAARASRALTSGCFLTRRSEIGTYITYFYIDPYIHTIYCNSNLRGV